MDSPTQPGPPSQSSGLRARLTAALPGAMKAGDRAAVAAIRSVLGALSNAEAHGVGTPFAGVAGEQPAGSADVAGSTVGVGSTEALRRALAEREVAAIALAEVSEREEAAQVYDDRGHRGRGDRLRTEAAAIRAFLV